MGLVDFAIDLAAVLGASRSVAAKHIALRGRQLNRYKRTSSVVDAVRSKQRAGAQAPTAAAGRDATKEAAEEPAAAPAATPAAAAFSSAIGTGGVSSLGESAQDSSAVPPAATRAVEDRARERPGQAAPGAIPYKQAPALSAFQQDLSGPFGLRDLRTPFRKLNVDKIKQLQVDNSSSTDTQPPDGTEQQEMELVPEGVNLNVFQTSRGGRLSPRWMGDMGGRPAKKLAHADLGVFKDRDDELVVSSYRVERNLQEPTVAKAVEGALPDPEVDHVSPVHESHRETEEVEVPRYPDPEAERTLPVHESHREKAEFEVPRYPDTPVEDSSVKTEAGHTETGTKAAISEKDAAELGEMLGAAATPQHELRESRVPSSRLGRLWSYSGLAAGMLTGAVSEFSSRALGGGGEGSVMFSPANMERLVAKLSTMRGAALKIGQMMSFQDEKMLPGPIQEVLQRVQDRADYMPAWQRDRVLTTNLGADWRDLFEDFEDKPIAAASIGQVHRAVLKSNGAKVAVKIQYPGVADSINSDLNNLRMLLVASKLLPKGLYLDKTIDNARTELGWECDYEREAACAQRYKALLASEGDVFRVPAVYPQASGRQVLTMEFMDGVGVTRVASFTQAQRDWLGTQILRLCLREITEFRFMQTDPNWTNFLYDAARARLVLLDFGASREFHEGFVALYVRNLAAAARADRAGVKRFSEELGYLTGHESKAMVDAHVTSVLTLAEPFLESAPEVYDFRDQTITERVKAQIPVMIKERLAPPPEETYSLHRKLSGAFLLCARLGSRVRCREMFVNAVAKSGMLEEDV